MAGKNIIVIGAGAAGLMAACSAATAGNRVTVLERNEKAGKKIYITGKGRCNFTNDCDPEEFLTHVVSNPRFLYSALYGFPPQAMMEFLEENGCRVKVERGARAFPVSDHASDVTKALLHNLRASGGQILYHSRAKEILTEDAAEGALPRVTGVSLESGKILHADAVILCTGGKSYPSTGSTGDGYRMAAALGLGIREAEPSLVPFTVKEPWCAKLQGLALKNVRISVYPSQGMDGGKKKRRPVYEGFGEMLFTHFGVSGPLLLTASCYCSFPAEQAGQGKEYRMFIDLKPAITEEELEARLERELGTAGTKHFPGVLRPLFPARLTEAVAELAGLGPERTAASVNRREIRELAALIKRIPVTLTGTRGFQEAVVTRGGISVRDFDPSTMECKRIRGLYAAGEVLDLDAHTGGFNLQIAWSTGRLAGISAGEKQRTQ